MIHVNMTYFLFDPEEQVYYAGVARRSRSVEHAQAVNADMTQAMNLALLRWWVLQLDGRDACMELTQ